MARLSVFVATPEEIREACGPEVLACYFPAEDEMVVSGVDRPVDGGAALTSRSRTSTATT